MAEVKNINGYDLKDYQLDTLQVSANEGKFVKIASNGLAADVVDLSSKQDKLTSENAGDNVTITSGSGGGHNLPSGYTELEYIESNGTQYINTGKTLNTSTDTLEVKYENTGGTTNFKWAFGSYGGASLGITTGSGTKSNNFYYNNVRTIDSSYFTGQHTFLADSNGVSMDGTNVVSYVNFTISSNLYLFATNNSGAVSNYGNYKIYHYKQTRNGSDIINLIPAKNSDNVIGMYDLVSDTFFTNAGSSNFTAGPAASSVTKINALTGLTASVSEINVLDGITATTTELNYTDGVTSNIQTQLNSKSTVSVSESGSATDTIQYITVDGTEKKLAGGGDDASFGTNDILQFIDGTNTPIEANPTAAGTTTLNKLLVGSTVYNVGGSGGTSSAFVISADLNQAFNSAIPTIQVFDSITDTEGVVHPLSDFTKGSTVYVTNQGVPDRWASGYISGGPDVPIGYTQYEYLEYSADSYITIPLQLTGTSTIRIVSDVYGAHHSDYAKIMGYSSSTAGPPCSLWSYQNKLLFFRGSSTVVGDDNTWVHIDISVENQYFSNFYLFDLNPTVTNYICKTGTKIKNTQIYINNVLKFNLIPAKDTNNEYGYWNTINRTFYPNSSTGTFIPGPEVATNCVQFYAIETDNTKESTANKVTTLSAESTDTQFPSAKCVYDLLGTVEATLDAIRGVV